MLVLSLLVFATFLLTHITIWKIKVPIKQSAALLKISGLTILLFLIFSWPFYGNFLAGLHIFIVFISLVLAYLITYSAVEVDSPSLVIINMVAESGSVGISKDRLLDKLSDEKLVIPRIDDLKRDNLVYSDGKYKLSAAGYLMTRLFVVFRKFLNLPKGG